MATVTLFDLNRKTSGLGEASTYIEGQNAVRLAPDAVVNATGNFNGQTLTLSGLSGELEIGFAGGISIVNNSIRIGGSTIGTFIGGTGGTDLVITFNSNATASLVEKLIGGLTVRDSSDTPITTHAITFNLAGTVRIDTLTVTPVDDLPAIDLNGPASGNNASAAFTEQKSVVVSPAATLADPNSDNLTALTARLMSRPDGNAVKSLSLNEVAASAAQDAGLTVSYNQGHGTLTITGAASQAVYQTILQGIVYDNTSENPNTSGRTVRVTVNDGTNTSAASDVSISVTRVNDAPAVDLNGGDAGSSSTLAYTPEDPLTKIAPVGTVADMDSPTSTAAR